MLAGAGLATGLSPTALMKALAWSGCTHLSDIEHVVILVQENRSFDNYFGRYKGVRGFDDTSINRSVFSQSYNRALEPLNVPDPLQPFHIDTKVTLPAHAGECTNDIDHQWLGQHQTWNGGALDNWMGDHIATNGPSAGLLTMGYYQGSPKRDHSGDVDFYWALADNFTICDNYYCSVIGGTDINRLYSITGTTDPDGWDGGLQFVDTQVTKRPNYLGSFGKKAQGAWKPYPQVLSEHGVSWKVYSDVTGHAGDNVLGYFKHFIDPTQPDFLRAFGSQTFPIDFAADCLTGQLPKVSWLLADLLDSEHPPTPIEWGAGHHPHCAHSPAQLGPLEEDRPDHHVGRERRVLRPRRSAGCSRRHRRRVPRPRHHRGRFGRGTGADRSWVPGAGAAGFTLQRQREPRRAPLVCSDTFDHTSLLRFLETRFNVPIPMRDPGTQTPGLSQWRRDAVGDLTSAFNFNGGMNPGKPKLPPTNRLDPRVLTECIITGEVGTLDAHTAAIAQGYPVPSTNSMPRQEPSPGPVKRPSGPC